MKYIYLVIFSLLVFSSSANASQVIQHRYDLALNQKQNGEASCILNYHFLIENNDEKKFYAWGFFEHSFGDEKWRFVDSSVYNVLEFDDTLEDPFKGPTAHIDLVFLRFTSLFDGVLGTQGNVGDMRYVRIQSNETDLNVLEQLILYNEKTRLNIVSDEIDKDIDFYLPKISSKTETEIYQCLGRL